MTRLIGSVAERLGSGDEQRDDDEVGRVGDRRQGVGGQHGQARDPRQPLVLREVRRDRFPEKKTFEAWRSGLIGR